MNRHLVTVKVGVKRSANQRVQLNGLAFNQHGLEGLNTQAVKCWRTVQHDRMLANHFFQNVPYDGFLVFNKLLGLLDGGCNAHHFQAVENERLEQFERHQFWQTTLVQF